MTFDTDGFEEFQEVLKEFGHEIETIKENLPRRVDEATEEAAIGLHSEMVAEIRRKNAIDSGELLNSVVHTQEESAESGRVAKYSVGPTADHAPYVEYGTAPHPITPDGVSVSEAREWREQRKQNGEWPTEAKLAPKLYFTTDGEIVSTVLVEHPGTSPQPFFRDSVNTAREKEWLAEALSRETNELFDAVMR